MNETTITLLASPAAIATFVWTVFFGGIAKFRTLFQWIFKIFVDQKSLSRKGGGWSKRRSYLEENVGADAIALTLGDLAEIDEVMPAGSAAGERYAEVGMRTLNR